MVFFQQTNCQYIDASERGVFENGRPVLPRNRQVGTTAFFERYVIKLPAAWPWLPATGAPGL